MTLLKSRRVAAVIMAVLICAGIFIGGGRSLRALYHDAEQAFYQGENGDGLGIQHDLELRMEYAYNLATVARKYLPDSVLVQDVVAAHDALLDSGSIASKYDRNIELQNAVVALYQELGTQTLSDEDARYRESLYRDFTSHGDMIGRSGYNALASAYNAKLERFPANILRVVCGVPQAELFQ